MAEVTRIIHVFLITLGKNVVHNYDCIFRDFLYWQLQKFCIAIVIVLVSKYDSLCDIGVKCLCSTATG